MADTQRIVDEIRFRLESGDCELNDELQRIANEYAALCHDVNTRLRRCGEFLKQGLRAEAMHLAEAEPNLLDAFAVADFLERAEWDEVQRLYQMALAEPLLSDVAEQLNEAYALQQPLEKLFDRHRLLAICRAPLAQRLSVMRKLAEADPSSTFWTDDICQFERARAVEIELEADAASARGDGDALFSLVGELSSPDWRQPPPGAVVQSVRRQAMQSVADQLATAHVGGNLERGRMLREKWNELSSRTRPSHGDGLAIRVEPALKWLAAEETKSKLSRLHHERLTALEHMLATPATPLVELESARREILKSGRDVPEPLAGRLRGRTIELRQLLRNDRRRVLGIAITVTVVIVGVLGFMVRSSLRHEEARSVATSAEQMIGQGNLRQARELLGKNEWMSGMDQYLAVHVRLVEAEKKEESRVADFRAAVERAQSAATFLDAEPALKEADRLTVGSDERRIVADLVARLNLKTRESASDDEQQFQQRLTDATDLLDRIEELQRKAGLDSAFVDLVKIAGKKIADLRRSALHVNPNLVRHVDAAESRLARIQKAIAHLDQRKVLLERLNRDSFAGEDQADPDVRLRHFGSTLLEFAEAFPTDAKSSHFATIAKDVELWRGVTGWQHLKERWKTLWPRTLAEAKTRIGECKTWLDAYAASPPGPMIREHVAFLASVVSREEGDAGDEAEGLRTKLLNLFSGPLIEDVEVVETKAGQRYYVKGRFEWMEGKPLRYIAGFRGETKSLPIEHDDLKLPQSREAPQAAFRQKVRNILGKTTLTTWDDSLREITESLRTDHDMDPFLRYYFLLRVLEFAKDGNSLREAELEQAIARLRRKPVNLSVRWMDPRDDDARKARRDAQDNVNSVGDLGAVWVRARRQEQEFEQRLFQATFPVGWLSLDEQGRWQCRSNWKPQAEFDLSVISRDSGEKAARWVNVGATNRQGEFSLSKDAGPSLSEGQLVFARERI